MANTKSKKAKKSSMKSKAAAAKTEGSKKAKEVEAVEAKKKELKDAEVETTDEVVETEVEEVEETEEPEDTEIVEEIEEVEVVEDDEDSDDEDITPVKVSSNPLKGFFAKKCDKNETILTIFKSPRIWGAILGEIVGTMLLTIILLTLGIYQPLYVMFGMLAITMAVYAFSGAHLNPIVTAGMMATRRVSAIRGILYIVAQIVGAWFGLLVTNAFRLGGGETAAELPTMTTLENGTIWSCILIELVGAIIIGYFFTRAQAYRSPRGAFTYAAMIAGGVMIAILFGIVVSGNFLNLQNNFVMNPAVAIMYQIFPTAAENFGTLMGQIALAGATYIIIPMAGGILGSFFSDISSKLSGEETLCCGKCPCKK